MKAKKERGVDPPPKIQAVIDSLTSIPLECIETPLARFTWEYDKGDFYHWVELMNHFDSYFEKHVKPRKDLRLEGEVNEAEPLPKNIILQILRVTRIILDNCVNKHCYSSYEHLSSLLASADTEIVIASLQTLCAFVKKSIQSNWAARWHGDQTLNLRLFSLAQGWGSKEEGLGLVACAMESGCDENALRLGSNLHFEFYLDAQESEGMDHRLTGLKVIHKDLQNECRSELDLLQQLFDEYKVPSNLRFSLFTRLRFAKSFPHLRTRRKYLCIRLLAFIILLQSNPDAEDLSAFFDNEPEFVNELVLLLHCEDTVPEDIRTLSLLSLAAQAQDRLRQASVLAAIRAGGNRGILPILVQKSIGYLNGTKSNCSVPLVEALLFLITVLVSRAAGCAALRESGLIPTLIPFLKDTNPSHTHLVASGVHILEALMNYSNPAKTLFRDLGGLDDAITRLDVEINRVKDYVHKIRKNSSYSDKGKLPAEQMDKKHDLDLQPEPAISFPSRLLLKSLLRAISLGTYAPGNATRIQGSEENVLASCMCTIFRNAKDFGDVVFSLAASLMSDLIHKDPTCFQTLDSAGLPAAFLESINEVLPSSEAVSCIHHSLDALCLNNVGLQAVKDKNALHCYVKIFTSKFYLRALENETPSLLGFGLNNLMRHAPSLRGDGVDACIEILRTIATIGGFIDTGSKNDDDTSVPMEADSKAVEQQLEATTIEAGQQSEATHSEVETSELFLLELIHNAARLLQALLQNADTSRIFVEKKGVEAILNLFSLPNLPVSFGGSSVAHSMSSPFRAFSPSHAIPLSRAVCSALQKSLRFTIENLNVLDGARIFDMQIQERRKLVRCLSSTELYLSLSSVLVRSFNTTMTELSAGGIDVLYDLGKVYREVLWQISMYDDAKAELKHEQAGDAKQGSANRETEEDSTAPVQYVNSVSIQNGSSSQWDTEPDFFSMISSGDGFHRRTRREQGAVADLFSQRMRRLARHAPSQPSQLDVEAAFNVEATQTSEGPNQKSPDSIDYEVMTRLANAARGLYVALGKAMVVPSRRRDDVAAPGSAAKEVSAAIAKICNENIGFDGGPGSPKLEMARSLYFHRLVDDIQLILFDSRRNSCNTLLINNFYAYGALSQLLQTFQGVNNMLWTITQESDVVMDDGESKSEVHDIDLMSKRKSRLFETLQSFAKLMEHLVTPTILLSPQPTAQMLSQQVPGSLVAIPTEPETFVQRLQSQVLEFVLPVWNHPLFPKCNVNYITSVVSIITHIYTGVSSLNPQRNAGPNVLVPPPDESSISMIVEMGFSRERAIEALRRVVTNSVEMAMEWLFSHPEEPQEDDELARALMLSLGNSDGLAVSDGAKGKETANEVIFKTPPVEDILCTCITLLQSTDVAFPLTDLLVALCSRNKGHDRSRVVTYFINHLKLCAMEDALSDSSLLSVVSHLLALILNEDCIAREHAAEQGLISIALDILSTFNAQGISVTTPKWVTALLLVLDLFSQFKPKVSQDQQGLVTGSSDPLSKNKLYTGEIMVNDRSETQVDPFVKVLDKYTGFMTLNEQHRAMKIACNFLNTQFPATTIQAVLQLCARLSKTHSVAMQFLESGGLAAILSLPRRSLFPGFDSVAAVIIRHLLEDPQTLQQAMELEIRHMLTTSSHRHNGRVSPRMFLTAVAPVVLRNPAIFMQASAAICQVENYNGQPYIVLCKERERERDQEKEKEKDEKDREKARSSLAAVATSSSDGNIKAQNSVYKSKGHKKVPQSFAQVLDQLLEVVLHSPTPTCHSMDESISAFNKGKSKCEETMVPGHGNSSEGSAGLAKAAFILKLMMEILLMYSGAVGVVIRRDSELSQGRVVGSDASGHGGLLYHILHRLLPYSSEKGSEKVTEDEWREKLSDKSAYFLLVVCVRSAEGRRRIVSEISKALMLLSNDARKGTERKLQPPNMKIRAFVFLINLILSAQAPGFSTDVAKTMIDAGLVRSLTSTLEVIDLDHPDAVKLVNVVLKVLEALTRAASSADAAIASSEKKGPTAERNPAQGSDGALSQSLDVGGTSSTHDSDLAEAQMIDEGMPLNVEANNTSNLMESVPPVRTDMADGAHRDSEAQAFMHEPSSNPSGSQAETVVTEITFMVEHNTESGHEDDEDEEMEGEDGEEEEEDEEDEDEMEGAEEVTHMSPPDTDLEEEHEDDGLDDYGNHGNILEHAGSAPLTDFSGDPFQSMNEIFSSFRRPVVERRRTGTGSRPSTDRAGGDRGVAFHHPLLTRQPLSSSGVPGSTAAWNTTASVASNSDTLRGIGFDVAPYYMYDHVLSDTSGNRLFGDRSGGGLLPPLLDFSMDPSYLTVRRANRSENRLSTWTDDGHPQTGAYAAAVAQRIEEQYVSRLRSLMPETIQLVDQTPVTTVALGQVNDAENMEGVESHTENRETRSPQNVIAEGLTVETQIPPNYESQHIDLHQDESARLVDAPIEHQERPAIDIHNIGAQMDGQNSANEEGMERHNHPDRMVEPEVAETNVEEELSVNINIDQQHTMQAEGVTIAAVEGNASELVTGAGESEAATQQGYQEMATIDPTFLEALPEYLRAEVLASHENQISRTANVAPPVPLPTEDIDPEFLAALPPDIQAEVLAQQRAQRLVQSQQGEGQPVDMDSASIIATFPAELREEVLLTSSDQVLAALPPSLLAEAQLLRERAMNQYQSRGLFTGANRYGIRRNNPVSGLDRSVGSTGGFSVARRSGALPSIVMKTTKEVEGKPLVDMAGLKSMLHLLYLAQPLGKGLLQRVLLNLCAHSVTRTYIVRLLLDMLKPGERESSGSEVSRLYGCRWNVVYSRSQVSDGVPPLVSRRVLEILTHLSKHHGAGADLLTHLKLFKNRSTIEEKGKSKLIDESCSNLSNGEVPLVVLLQLLNQPLYSRSSAHLEQLMVLLEVIINHISTKHEVKNIRSENENSDIPPRDCKPNRIAQFSLDIPGTSRADGNIEQIQPLLSEPSRQCEVNENEQLPEQSTSGTERTINISEILSSLPVSELRKLCNLLAQQSLSEVAYSRITEVIRKLAQIAPNHRCLFKEELEDAARRLTGPAITELSYLGHAETMTLSTNSMVGAAILRVLQCLSSLTADIHERGDSEITIHGEGSAVRNLNITLDPLWQALSSCIARLEGGLSNYSAYPGSIITANGDNGNTGIASPLPPETQRVLPFVEAFFVLSEKLRESSTPTHLEPGISTAQEIKEAASSSGSIQSRIDRDLPFLKFAEKHRRMLNAFLRQNPPLLEKCFSLLLRTPRLIDFDNKRSYFRARIRQQHEQQHFSPLRICVRRPYILEDSYNQLRMRTVEELKGRFTVQFQGEEGIDAGGLTREWYQLLSRVIFDKGALLFTTVGNESSFQPNPNSVFQTEHLSYFKFVGRVVAKALYDGQLLDVYFTRSFYKHILGVKVTYHDIEAVDPDYYKNLKWMLENDISDVVGVFFSVDADEEKHILYEKTEVTDIELIPGGRNIRVTEENKHEYVDLNAEHKLTTAIRPQINAFLEGFNELINRDLISIFNDKELELLISGLPEIDLDDLKANTEYTGSTAASPVVQWFWEVVHEFSKEDKARLLQFITGTSRVPLEGFKALQGISGPQRCQIHKAYGAPERLPTAHTCFNQLDLPEYSSKQQLQERLLLAIHEGSEGFGFG